MADDTLSDSEAFELHAAIADRAKDRAAADARCKSRVARVMGGRPGPFIVYATRPDGTTVNHIFYKDSFSAEVPTVRTVENPR